VGMIKGCMSAPSPASRSPLIESAPAINYDVNNIAMAVGMMTTGGLCAPFEIALYRLRVESAPTIISSNE
jgi:hypothetical protein